jgi:hypothetical protein
LLNTPVVLVKDEELVLFMLKCNPVILDVTLMVPVATVHVGWVTLTVGAAGLAGFAFTIKVRPADTQPMEFLDLMT